jgi:hypothetical protein
MQNGTGMLHSGLKMLGKTTFPSFRYERIYMFPFKRSSGLPQELVHWQPTVDMMLSGITSDRTMYLMVDQKDIAKGEYHRRPGVHVDGHWDGLRHYHHRRPIKGKKETVLLASDVSGCCAYVGVFPNKIGDKGNCENIDVTNMARVIMQPGVVYACTATTLHESLAMEQATRRTVVRINVPGWEC